MAENNYNYFTFTQNPPINFPFNNSFRPDPSPKRVDPDLDLFINQPADQNEENYGKLNGGLKPKKNMGFIRKSVSGNGSGLNLDNNDDFDNNDPNMGTQNEIFVGFNPNLISGNGSGFDFDNVKDEWEFITAFSGNGVMQGNLSDHGGSCVDSEAKVEKVVMLPLENQAAADTSYGSRIIATAINSTEHKPDLSSSLPQSRDLSVYSFQADGFTWDSFTEVENIGNGAANITSEMLGSFKPISVTGNGFMIDTFSEVGDVGNGNRFSVTAATTSEDDDFDDFGDFIDASQEAKMRKQDEPSVVLNNREALPLSFFGYSSEKTSETLDHFAETVYKPNSGPGNSFVCQGSVVSIHDLVSNLYSQAQSSPSVGSNEKPAENEVHNLQEQESPDYSWEFKDAFQESGVREKPSPRILLGTFESAQNYIAFYTELRDSLCILLSSQLDELQKAGFSEITETLENEIREVQKLLKPSIISQVVSEKHAVKSCCLNEVFKILERPEFQMFESEHSLSKNLQLAVNDWRIAADLLRHAISILKSLSLGTVEDQFRYVSTWSDIIDVCAQELRHSAMIWKRASEKKVEHQILSDCRGQKYIQALGEIFKVVELLGLSANVYKAWMLYSVSDSSRFTGILNECRDLWSNSGLEEALQNLSDDTDFGCEETAKALLVSIKKIRDFDVLTMYDCVFAPHKSICRLSLLPQEMLSDLKSVMWDEQPYFTCLANFWVNMISHEPPRLPDVQVS